jgi:A/G-specific adenine glycosylase
MSGPDSSPIAQTLITWHARHGRHDLPWQRAPTPYRVWVSEIMLQQTQVGTVIGYYDRFMERFPDVAALAAAPLDEVLHCWSGLGYYSRARNLQRAAQRIVSEHAGRLPEEVDSLAQLPGIGPSTAAAIVALAHGRRATILDGNVKRVLARYFAIEGASAQRSTQQELWRRAEQCTPAAQVASYTQAIMDFGATLCTRRAPLCMHCPLREGCSAHRLGRVHELPVARERKARRTRQVVMLLAVSAAGAVLLQRRPAHGVWGGLWAPPEFAKPADAAQFCGLRLQAAALDPEPLPLLRHAFTHFDLQITPWRARCEGAAAVMEGEDWLWYNAREPARIGLPAPISALLACMGN